MKPSTAPLMLIFGCLFAAEGYVLLRLVAWAANISTHWIVVSIVSIVFFYFGLVVASVFLMGARDEISEKDKMPATKQSSTVAAGATSHPKGRRAYAEAGS